MAGGWLANPPIHVEHSKEIPLGISSIKWSNPGTRLSHHFRHYKMEKNRLGVVFERFIIIFINYHFWARTIL